MTPAQPRRQRGASLVEGIVAVGIVGGSLHLALPALQDMTQAARLSAASQALLSDLQLARSEAVRRNRKVSACKSPDGESCGTAGGWEQGWILFQDENGNGRRDAEDEILQRHEALAGGMRARGNQTVADYVSYTPLGVSTSRTGAFQAGTLTVCRASAEPTDSRQVIVNAMGRPRVQRGVVASCDG